MIVRPFTVEDAAAFRALRLRALQDSPEAFGRAYEEYVGTPLAEVAERLRPRAEAPDDVVLGAFADGAALGMAGLQRQQGLKVRHKGIIWGVYVAPEARGRGIGRQLLEELLAHAGRCAGLEQLHLAVVSTNEAARQLYFSLGFERYGSEPRGLRVGTRDYDEDLLVLRLAP